MAEPATGESNAGLAAGEPLESQATQLPDTQQSQHMAGSNPSHGYSATSNAAAADLGSPSLLAQPLQPGSSAAATASTSISGNTDEVHTLARLLGVCQDAIIYGITASSSQVVSTAVFNAELVLMQTVFFRTAGLGCPQIDAFFATVVQSPPRLRVARRHHHPLQYLARATRVTLYIKLRRPVRRN